MKIAIITLNKRPIITTNNIRDIELITLRQMLIEKYKTNNVYFVGYKIKKEIDIDYYLDYKKYNLNEFDKIFVYNTMYHEPNIFGYNIIQIRQLLNYKNEIIYFLTDPKMPLVNYVKYWYDKVQRGVKIHVRNFNGELYYKFEIQLFEKLKWKIWFAGHNYNEYLNILLKNNAFYDSQLHKIIIHVYDNYVNIPYFFKYLNRNISWQINEYNYKNKQYDFVYFGDNRGTRTYYFKKYFNINANKLFIGPFDKYKDKNTKIIEKQPHNILPTYLNKCISTIVIGDKTHNGNIVTPRFYECIKAGLITFIDIDYDPNKLLFKHPILKKFNYIKSKQELEKRINKIKNNPEKIKQIILLQDKEWLHEISDKKRTYK